MSFFQTGQIGTTVNGSKDTKPTSTTLATPTSTILGTSTPSTTTGTFFGTPFSTQFASAVSVMPSVPVNTNAGGTLGISTNTIPSTTSGSIFGRPVATGLSESPGTLLGATQSATTGMLSNVPTNTTLGTISGTTLNTINTIQAPLQSSMSTPFSALSQQNSQNTGASGLNNLPLYTWGGPSQKMVSRYNQLQIQTPSDTLETGDLKSGVSQSGIFGSGSILGLDQFPSIVDQLQRLKNAWDPTHPDCAFQYYFYNRVPADEVALYVKPLHHNQQKWDEAIANRPENSVVPALAVGFSDIQKRVQLQEQQVMAYRIRMHEIVNKLGELSQKHDLSTTIKISEATLRHLELARRLLALAARVQVLKGRGYALQSEEENLKQRLKELTLKINEPSVFGRMNELWARMTFIREKAKSIEKEREGGIVVNINWKKDEEQLEKITRVLGDQYTGISYVIHILKGDLNEVEKALEIIEERKKALERPRSRGPRIDCTIKHRPKQNTQKQLQACAIIFLALLPQIVVKVTSGVPVNINIMLNFEEINEGTDNKKDLEDPDPSSSKRLDAFDLDTDEELSELDEEQFKDLRDAQVNKSYLNEYNVHDLPRFKRKRGISEETVKPKKVKGIKKRRRGVDILSKDDSIELKHEMDPGELARRELDQALNEAIMSSRKKKRREEDLEEIADDEIIALREKMRQAAIEDIQANEEKRPAIQKLRMLSEVENALRKYFLYCFLKSSYIRTSFTESILDNNLLEAVRIWLEPLPDRSLPALNIQKVLFSALSRLPIQTEHLRESGVGKVVLFYKQSKKPDLFIKRQADQLISEWSRPIIKRSSNYRDRSISTVLYNPDTVAYSEQKISGNDIDDSKKAYKKTIIPTPISSSYEIAPKVHLRVNSTTSKTRNDDHIRKLKQKMQKMKQLGKRNSISIEGRKLIQ
ncbi:hypothetical protein PMAC_002905 [Pneumocystis sp. 'macacae']|nr:hypothetical protein PMAC_002905 [Pneumocystis sp. 'macacae']